MLITDLFRLFKARAALIAAVAAVSVLSGLALFHFQTATYEIVTLLEVRRDVVEVHGSAMPSIVRDLVEGDALRARIAKEAGLSGPAALPALKVDVGYDVRLLKVYAFVPAGEIARTKRVFGALIKILNDEFPADDSAYFSKAGELKDAAQRLRAAQGGTAALAALSRDARGLAELSEYSRSYARRLKALDLRVILFPTVSERPALLSLSQALIAFALLGLFAGFAAVLSLEERRK